MEPVDQLSLTNVLENSLNARCSIGRAFTLLAIRRATSDQTAPKFVARVTAPLPNKHQVLGAIMATTPIACARAKSVRLTPRQRPGTSLSTAFDCRPTSRACN